MIYYNKEKRRPLWVSCKIQPHFLEMLFVIQNRKKTATDKLQWSQHNSILLHYRDWRPISKFQEGRRKCWTQSKNLNIRQISCDGCWTKPIVNNIKQKIVPYPSFIILWTMKFIISTEPYKTCSSYPELKFSIAIRLNLIDDQLVNMDVLCSYQLSLTYTNSFNVHFIL